VAGARTIWHIHDDLSVVQFPGQTRLTRGTFSALAHLPDAFAVLSEKDREVAERYVSGKKLAVLPPTCDPQLLSAPLERADGAIRVLYVGWLTPAKGIYELLAVARALQARHKQIHFDVLGTGMSANETQAVEQLVQDLNLGSMVRLWGVITGDAKCQMFANAHVFFTPTHWDAFPVAVLEAMAAGLPIVGTRVGGLPGMFGTPSGGALLPDVCDVEQMIDCLRLLAEDPHLRTRMGAENRARFIEQYHRDRIGEATIGLYHRLERDRRLSR
jgi:glycosyltransferase involved in cell wall biosynthesis